MIISHRHKFVLLTPWKTASSTTHARLQALNESPYSGFFHFNPFLNRVVHRHITYAEFATLPESRLGYKVAAFVRNPYDRAYSGFLQLQRDIKDQPSLEFPADWIKTLVMKQLVENQTKLFEARYDFDLWIELLEEYEVSEVGRNTSLPLYPANYWTHYNAIQAVNFVGKVEEFEADFAAFCRFVDIDFPERINENVSVQFAEGGRYRYEAQMSASTLSKINELFKSDFDLFGYTQI
ncbi:sulfotransferase family protein (plasmid) [Sinorhizobium garamanticum]|uniref:Sulfotransferase family protein n=1 Tax=Sinorhizobium garamanticum TaxID=680247 RepID=A0ABY8DQ71_9HYPH|nr:sulfotransferase family 2 domain-containing protein [Sinorhizobium garamanticum]WEX91705.1 sulfotransferase family protein [Sinorhizobium garamanticum]